MSLEAESNKRIGDTDKVIGDSVTSLSTGFDNTIAGASDLTDYGSGVFSSSLSDTNEMVSSSENKLAYVPEPVKEISDKTSKLIIILSLSIIVALIFVVKICFFEKKKNPKNSKPEEGLRSIIIYLFCVIFVAVGLYGAGIAATIISNFLLIAFITVLLIGIIYIIYNHQAIVNKLGTSGPFFNQIYENIHHYGGKYVISMFLSIINFSKSAIPLIGNWLNVEIIYSINFYKYSMMIFKIIIRIILLLIISPFLIMYGSFYFIWAFFVGLLMTCKFLWNNFKIPNISRMILFFSPNKSAKVSPGNEVSPGNDAPIELDHINLEENQKPKNSNNTNSVDNTVKENSLQKEEIHDVYKKKLNNPNNTNSWFNFGKKTDETVKENSLNDTQLEKIYPNIQGGKKKHKLR